MTDRLSKEARSAHMALIRSKDTKPELVVRRLLHRLGYRYRIHVKGIPGKPDIAFTARRKIVLVHGCFWHFHGRCAGGRIPESNAAYWQPKLLGNKARDKKRRREAKTLGWEVMTVWECEIANPRLPERLIKFLGPPQNRGRS